MGAICSIDSEGDSAIAVSEGVIVRVSVVEAYTDQFGGPELRVSLLRLSHEIAVDHEISAGDTRLNL